MADIFPGKPSYDVLFWLCVHRGRTLEELKGIGLKNFRSKWNKYSSKLFEEGMMEKATNGKLNITDKGYSCLLGRTIKDYKDAMRHADVIAAYISQERTFPLSANLMSTGEFT